MSCIVIDLSKTDILRTSCDSLLLPYRIYIMTDQSVENGDVYPIEVYVSERKLLVDIQSDQSKLLDRSVISISTGALLASATFVSRLKGQIQDDVLSMLTVATWSLSIALLLTMITFAVTQIAARKAIRNLDSIYTRKLEHEDARNGWANVSFYANFLPILALGFGLCFLVSALLAEMNHHLQERERPNDQHYSQAK